MFRRGGLGNLSLSSMCLTLGNEQGHGDRPTVVVGCAKAH